MTDTVLLLGDPRLRRTCDIVTDFSGLEFVEENRRLKNALDAFRKEKGFGRGIAAPQIGIPKRMIALNLGSGTRTIVNPVITRRSDATFTMWDDCMSFPDLLVMVRRHVSISISYRDENGEAHEWTNMPQAESELMQHEMDHLEGTLFIDHLSFVKSNKIKNEIKKHGYPEKQTDEELEPELEKRR